MKTEPIQQIVLNLKDAIKLEAKQNMERDLRVLGKDDVCELEIYLIEAKHILTSTGEGYIPEFADHKHVVVKKS
jgi:hypothetical protein